MKCQTSLDSNEQTLEIDAKLSKEVNKIKLNSNEVVLSLGHSTSHASEEVLYNLGNFHMFHQETPTPGINIVIKIINL